MKLTCKDASHLISARLDRRLSLRERVSLYIHLRICDACARVQKQMAFLRRAMEAYVRQRGEPAADPARKDGDSRPSS